MRIKPALLLVALCALIAPGSAYADTTVIGFDNLDTGVIVQGQYRNAGGTNHGVVFGIAPGQILTGVDPVVTAVGALAHSGTRVGQLSKGPCPTGECPGGPVGYMFFPFQKSFVTMYVGATGTVADTITVTAFDAQGTEISSTGPVNVTGGAGFKTIVGVNSGATARISYVAVQGTTLAPIGIDDLMFDQPAAPPPPSFALRGSGNLTIAQGSSASTFVSVTRQNGSTGSIHLDAAAPPGVHVTFNPGADATGVDGDRIMMTVSADPDAPPTTGAPITVTATPSGPQAGAGQQSIQYTVDVVQSFVAEPRVTGMEITQGVQFAADVRDPGQPDAPVLYGGVQLQSFRKTVVRVYADNALATPPSGSRLPTCCCTASTSTRDSHCPEALCGR